MRNSLIHWHFTHSTSPCHIYQQPARHRLFHLSDNKLGYIISTKTSIHVKTRRSFTAVTSVYKLDHLHVWCMHATERQWFANARGRESYLCAESLSSVIPLWRLLCCTVADPNRGVWVPGPLLHAPQLFPLPTPTGSLRVGGWVTGSFFPRWFCQEWRSHP